MACLLYYLQGAAFEELQIGIPVNVHYSEEEEEEERVQASFVLLAIFMQ